VSLPTGHYYAAVYECEAFDLVAASGEPKLWDLTPPEARKKVIELTRMVECQEAIGKIEDRTLAGPAGPLPFRVYTPLTANAEPSGNSL
jgi:hypothetical protein